LEQPENENWSPIFGLKLISV